MHNLEVKIIWRNDVVHLRNITKLIVVGLIQNKNKTHQVLRKTKKKVVFLEPGNHNITSSSSFTIKIWCCSFQFRIHSLTWVHLVGKPIGEKFLKSNVLFLKIILLFNNRLTRLNSFFTKPAADSSKKRSLYLNK